MAGYHLWDNNVIMSFCDFFNHWCSCTFFFKLSDLFWGMNTKTPVVSKGYGSSTDILWLGEIREFHSKVPKRTGVLIGLHAGTCESHWAKWIDVPTSRTRHGEFQCCGMLMKPRQMSNAANVAGEISVWSRRQHCHLVFEMPNNISPTARKYTAAP